jgi:NTE family protein
MNQNAETERHSSVVLALSGGNALGAYHAGALEALLGRGITPDVIAGTSIGAVTGAIYAGNHAENRLTSLRAFWTLVQDEAAGGMAWPQHQRWAAVGRALMLGRPGLFTPNMAWPFTRDPLCGLLSNAPAHETLNNFIDFDILNSAVLPFTAVAVDVETGEEVAFDTRSCRLNEKHLRGASAMPVLFPPVEVGGRWLCDGGLSTNLPIQYALARISGGHTLCIALDLFPRQGPFPVTMGDAVMRAQDLAFACQSMQVIQRAKAEFELAKKQFPDGPGGPPTVTVLHVCYAGALKEIAGKTLDYSARAIQERWDAGRVDLTNSLDHFDAIAPPRPGSFNLIRLESGRLVQ